MGFYSETQTLDQQAKIKDNLQCSSKSVDEQIKSVGGIANNNHQTQPTSPPPPPPLAPVDTTQQSHTQMSKLEASTTSTSSVFASIKALFTSNSADKSRCNSFESKSSTRPSTPKHDRSSGYHSLEDSLDMDDTYIKVCKFTGTS